MNQTGLDWTAYSQTYDELCDLIPAYEENVSIVLDAILSSISSKNPYILDVGAGTGNYIQAINSILPGASFVHLDANSAMNDRAKSKYEKSDIQVEIVQEYAQRARFAEESFDAILCINSLYALHPQRAILSRICRWLKADGVFIALDFGRQQKPFDWGMYLLRSAIKRKDLSALFRLLLTTRAHSTNARNGAAGQRSGDYWTHTTAEFGECLQLSGFDVVTLRTCYRDYADFAVCRKKLTGLI